jgi:hypothetical protein
MEGHCSAGQSPQWAVVSMEEEEEKKKNFQFTCDPSSE